MMPVFEQRLGELVEILPEVVINETNFKVMYNWGTIDVLKQYLANNPNCYPLVWLVPTKTENNVTQTTTKARATIAIATKSDKLHEFNGFIYDTDYKIILDVIENNLVRALRNSSISNISEEYQSEKMPNYLVTLSEKQTPIDIWNATFLDIEIEFNNFCLRPIIF
jgi:hypothetical protein